MHLCIFFCVYIMHATHYSVHGCDFYLRGEFLCFGPTCYNDLIQGTLRICSILSWIKIRFRHGLMSTTPITWNGFFSLPIQHRNSALRRQRNTGIGWLIDNSHRSSNYSFYLRRYHIKYSFSISILLFC